MKKEEELILIAVLTDRSEQEEAKLSALLPQELDWVYLSGLLVNHRLSGYFYNHLTECQKNILPREIREIFKLIVDAQKRRQVVINKEVNNLNSELIKNHLKFAGLKGVIFGAMLYNDGDRRSNDIDLLVSEEDLPLLDLVMQNMGYIQSNLPNGQLVKASRREKLIQRLNHHDLVPYVKSTDEGFLEVDINFLFDEKNNPIDKLVFEDGVYQYSGNGYSIMGLSIQMNLAFLCVHFYREATDFLWTSDKRDLTLYKLVDIINFIRRVKNKIDIYKVVETFKHLNIDDKCYYVFSIVDEFYHDAFVTQIIELLSYVDKKNLGYIYDRSQQKHVKRTRSFYDSIFYT